MLKLSSSLIFAMATLSMRSNYYIRSRAETS